jgi:hypothetical protein
VKKDNTTPTVLVQAGQFSIASLLKNKIAQKTNSRVGSVDAPGTNRVIEHRKKQNKGNYQDHP